MNDEDRRSRNQETNRSGPTIWLLVTVILVGIFAAIYFVNFKAQVVRYPELKELLKQTRYQNMDEDALEANYESKLVTTEVGRSGRRVELSKPHQIWIHEDAIRGKVFGNTFRQTIRPKWLISKPLAMPRMPTIKNC